MSMALRQAGECGLQVDAWPTPAGKKELGVRTPGGQIIIHFLNGRSETFSHGTRMTDVVDQIAAKHNFQSDLYGMYQTTRFGTGERLLSCQNDDQRTLGQICQEWIKQSLHYATLMGKPGSFQSDSNAMGDAKFYYRFFFLRKLIFSDSLARAPASDLDQLFWSCRKKITNGSFKCTEDDALTLAALRLQIEFGDHDPAVTPQKLKPMLSDLVPSNAKGSQSAKEWLSDICAIHSVSNTRQHAKNYLLRCSQSCFVVW
jgi:hypothetical protein